jgi:uncharacterized protein YkwD
MIAGSSLLLGMAPARSDADAPRPAPAVVRTGLRDDFQRLTNLDRREHDRQALALADVVSRYATRHSRRMAELGSIFHSHEGQLRGALDGTGWVVAGENVGVGPSLEDLEDAFMASAPHRENILNPGYEQVAVGIVESDGVLWITVIFYGD